MVFVGLAVGTVMSLLLTKTVSALLVAVTARDPAIFVSVPLLVTVVALGAVLLPVSRAVSVEPREVLRSP